MTKRPAAGAEWLNVSDRLCQFNGMLIFIMVYMSCCALNFGYDVGTFGGVQATQSFARQFGKYDERLGLYVLPGWLSSVMTATPFLGKAMGCVACGWVAEKWGRRAAILCLCVASFVGVILQVSSASAAQFTVGRIVTYGMTGMAIVAVPIYQSETSPRALRGMFGSAIQFMIVLGQLIATLVTLGTHHLRDAAAWQVPVGLQLLLPTVILALLPLLPESPRWLLCRGRRDEAVASLRRLRPSAVPDDQVYLEIEAIAHAHEKEMMRRASWAEVFDESNRVRTLVAVLAMFGQQITGQAFPSQYGVVFYQSQGFRDRAFLFGVLSNVISLCAVVITWFYVDVVGRRPVLLGGGFLMGAFLFVLGAMGTVGKENLNSAENGLVVASIMGFSFFYNLSWAPISYIIVSEVAALHVKEKTNLLACVISVLTTFVTSFTCPYLINDHYANLGSKVGFIYGSFNFTMVVLVFFFIPELKDRTLEEVDQLFASGMPLRKFGMVKTRTAEELYRDEAGSITNEARG